MYAKKYLIGLGCCVIVTALLISVFITACSSDGSPSETTPAVTTATTAPSSSADTTVPQTTLPDTTAGTTAPDTTVGTTAGTTAPDTTAGTTAGTTAPNTTPGTTWTSVTSASVYSSAVGESIDLSWGGVCYDNAIMEIVYTVSKFGKYQGILNGIKEDLPEVNVYALYCPTAIEFKGPSKYYGRQLKAMNNAYSGLVNVVGVDAWSYLDMYNDMDTYFKTDTHWSQQGAYCAYRGFADAAGFGFEAHDLSEYQSGTYEGFKGYFYNMKANSSVLHLLSPDTLTYYLPIEPATAYTYSSPAMSGGSKIAIVNTKFSSSNPYKYYCFTGGDRPLIKIESETVQNGRVLLMLKDSYGNALVPFLPDHFETVYVVDPRSFNTSSTPSFDLIDFARANGVTDILVQTNAFNAQGGLMNNISAMID